jgi:hypothetical protein
MNYLYPACIGLKQPLKAQGAALGWSGPDVSVVPSIRVHTKILEDFSSSYASQNSGVVFLQLELMYEDPIFIVGVCFILTGCRSCFVLINGRDVFQL